MSEAMRLNDIANYYDSYDQGVNLKSAIFLAQIFKREMRKGSILELGPAEGIMTKTLYEKCADYTIVDAAEGFIMKIKEELKGINGVTSLFEEYSPHRTFDNILVSNVLEHVEYPVKILEKCREWMSSGGETNRFSTKCK